MGELIEHNFGRAADGKESAQGKLGELLQHDFGNAAEHERTSLRQVLEAFKKAEGFGEGLGEQMEEWAADLERGDAGKVMAELRLAAPAFAKTVTNMEKRGPSEAVEITKRNAEIYELRSTIQEKLLHNMEKAAHYAKLAERERRLLEDAADLFEATTE